MRKHRSWLMGLGVGLVLGASMLQLILFAQDQAVMVAEEPLTVERISEEADKAGLLVLTQEQLDARVEEAVAEAQRAGKDGGTETSEPEASESPDAEIGSGPNSALEPPDETSEDGGAAESPAAETYSVYVEYGMSLTEVGEELKKLGLIDDVKDFIENARPVAKKMKVGTAIFSGKPTYQEIMDELVRKK